MGVTAQPWVVGAGRVLSLHFERGSCCPEGREVLLRRRCILWCGRCSKHLGGEAAGPRRRTRTPRASEGEAERPRRGAERCSRPTAPAAPWRGGRARTRGTSHAPGPPPRAARAPGTHRPRGGPGASRARRDCTVQRRGPSVHGRSRPEASPSPGMVCPVGKIGRAHV